MTNKSDKTNGNEKNKASFIILAILLPFFLLGIAEVALRVSSYGADMHLFINHNIEKYKNYYMVNPHVGEKYFSRFEATSGTNDIFLKQKPKNGFRIFLMGSSTLVGYPYDRNLMASRILHQRLQDGYPDKTIEVINTAFTAINSITLKDFIHQILKHEPDAILIYAGHNEFYGAFGIGSNETMSKSPLTRAIHFELMNFRIYQLMRSAIGGISKKIKSGTAGMDEKGTLMKRIVKDKDIIYKGEKYNIGINQFQNNLSDLLAESNKNGVPVFLSDLVSNIKDLPPFGDIPQVDQSAAAKYKEALKTLSNGDAQKAKDLFYEAKDLDPIRFRASEDINQIIYGLVKQKKAIFIPAKQWFENASPGQLIGNNLISEHLHPNIEGQFVLADAFYAKIVESGLIASNTNPLTEKTKVYYRHNWGYTALDSLVGEYKVKQLKSYWPFTSLNTDITFRDTFKTSGMIDSLAFTMITNPNSNIASLHSFLGDYYENHNQIYLAYREFESLVRINPYRSDYYNRVANCLLKLNDLYSAEKYLNQSIKFIETYFAYSILGEIESVKHNYKGAVLDYQLALKLAEEEKINTKDRIPLLIDLCKSYRLNNDSESAEEIINELSKLGYKGSIPAQSGNFEYSKYVPWNIEQTFQKAVSYYGTNVDSTFYYLSLCIKTNDCPLVNFYMGNILYQKKDIKVLQYYNKAYDAYRKDPNFLVRYCLANMANKDKIKAKAILRELIDVDPNYTDIHKLSAYVNN